MLRLVQIDCMTRLINLLQCTYGEQGVIKIHTFSICPTSNRTSQLLDGQILALIVWCVPASCLALVTENGNQLGAYHDPYPTEKGSFICTIPQTVDALWAADVQWKVLDLSNICCCLLPDIIWNVNETPPRGVQLNYTTVPPFAGCRFVLKNCFLFTLQKEQLCNSLKNRSHE